MTDPNTCTHCGQTFAWLCEAKNHAKRREIIGRCPRRNKPRTGQTPKPKTPKPAAKKVPPKRLTAADVEDFT